MANWLPLDTRLAPSILGHSTPTSHWSPSSLHPAITVKGAAPSPAEDHRRASSYEESLLPAFGCFYFRLLSPLPRSLLVYNIKASFLIPLSLPSQDDSTIFSTLRGKREAFFTQGHINKGFPGGSDGKESSCNAGDRGSIPGSGRSSEKGNGYPVQYSCLQNPTDRGAWQTTVHGITKSQTQLNEYLYSHCFYDSIKDRTFSCNRAGPTSSCWLKPNLGTCKPHSWQGIQLSHPRYVDSHCLPLLRTSF